jgi:hypothetical protein
MSDGTTPWARSNRLARPGALLQTTPPLPTPTSAVQAASASTPTPAATASALLTVIAVSVPAVVLQLGTLARH